MNLALHVGVDDTDSPRMGCTTYIAALLVDDLTRIGCRFIDYPNLVRLNPNVPWKTRGNGAICLRFMCHDKKISSAIKLILKVVKANSDMANERTDPAVACLKGDVPAELTAFSKKVIRSVVSIREAERIARKFNVSCMPIKGRKGLIGAIAAIGETLRSDHTYELIAYRMPRNRSSPRKVDRASVLKMNTETHPLTFNNVDPETGRILITPRGRDPILCGIRGETPQAVLRGHRIVRAEEPVERWVVFRTNHGTDDHLSQMSRILDIRPYRPAVVTGRVSIPPRTITGGHVIFRLSDSSGSIDSAAYEPTGNFRDIVRKLKMGDLLEAYGGIRKGNGKHGPTLNLEKIRILELAQDVRFENPHCPICGRRMESAGRGQGFRCRRCKVEDQAASKVSVTVERQLAPRIYLPPPRAHRHLTKPLLRYGREKTDSSFTLVESWHRP